MLPAMDVLLPPINPPIPQRSLLASHPHYSPPSLTTTAAAAAMASNTANAASEVSNAITDLNDHLATALGAGDEAGKTTVITLAGENNGAVMDAEDLVVVEAGGEGEEGEEEEEVHVAAYTNSNYQAVNNSVLLAGSCAVRDPGVHVVIVEHVDDIRDCDGDEIFEDGEVAK
ncbi:uncharacterized protein [Triticum aestivum]|uniref:Uncharacterized protein n=1 Tax=Triticum aestivum TaxID=4565 RepID=A0A3B6D4N5_WHEAT|nr:uncharacterized protein LOC123048286 [Triticum aestivum]